MSDSNQLRNKQQQYQKELTHQVKELSGKAQDWGKSALMIAGGVFVAYQLVKLFSGSKNNRTTVYKETYEDEQEVENARRIIIKRDESSTGVFDVFKAEIGAMLLALAKDKILEFINQLEFAKKNAPEEQDTE
jgi:hypothetical protein